MPLLSKRIFNCVKPLTGVKPDEKIYTIPHTKEQLRSQEEYEKRQQLYKKRIWTCQSTGHVNLTHEEAWNSEKAVMKTLKEQFAPCYDKPVLELVHHSTKSLDTLVDEAWLMLQQVLVVGERVLLKVKSGGKSMKAVIVKVDPAGYEGNPTSNCNSPSSDKENKDNNSSSPKKWVPPKLLPYKYSIRFENEDSVIHSVPANDLSRGDKPPSKELLRLFIRTYAVRAGHTPNSPWVVDETQVKKLDLQSKFASFLLSPVKWKADEIAKKIDEEVKSIKSASKASPRIKTKLEAKEEKRKEHAKKSITKIEKKSEKLKQQRERESKKNELVELNSSDDSSDNEEENEVMEVSGSDSDSDTPLSVVKTQLTPKKKSSDNLEQFDKVNKKKGVSLADLQKKLKTKTNDKGGKSKTPLTLADLKKKLEKKKLKKSDKEKKKSKKGQDPKQMTLLDSLKKKGLKTPEKKSQSKEKSPFKLQKTPDMKKKLMSPPRTPIVVQKLQQAVKKEDKGLIGLYSTQAAKILTDNQRNKLNDSLKELVMKKYNIIQEKLKLSKMTEEEKKAYLEKKAQERKEQYKKKLKEKKKNSKKKFEDTELELKPLPQPKLVLTPDGLPNELFGDVTMVTEFISCYSGLLMPDDDYPIYTDALMKALAAGKDGFTYLCRTLTVLLQTLLQDQIAEDYEELKVPLSDIPVNPGTCSELVRLCLRRQDVTDDKSDHSDVSEEVEEGEVPDELIQLLETQELYQLDAEQKLAILKGLCERIMGTYSVQDYMEEKQQESASLWRQQIAKWKEEKANQQAKKAEEKQKKENEKDPQDNNKKNKEKDKETPANNTLLTQFYGKKDEEGQTSGNNSETMEVDDDDDVISKIKRRRLNAAQAQEERRKKEMEERKRREKELEILKQQREKEQFEKDFSEGLTLARITQRQAPVGTDRNHSRYWVFCDVTPGVFVEKGWVGEEIDYTCRKDTDVDFESSSSSEDEEEGEGDEGANPSGATKKNKPAKLVKCVDTTFPRVGQNLWFTYDKHSTVNDLIDALHPQGSRESILKKELIKRQADINKAIYRQQRLNLELRDCDGDKEMIESLKKEVLETELRLRNGGLGGVDDFQTWNKKLETAVEVQTLADCLLECQENVLEKFRDGIMVIKKKKSINVKEEEEEEEEEKVEPPGIQQWREAVKSSGTLSRLHVLLGILDSCIKWEKSAENAKCKICRKKGQEDKLLLCDDCNQAFHIYCLRPALPCVPKGDWKCLGCAPLTRKRVIDMPGKYHEDSEDDEDIKEAKTKSIKHDEKCYECEGDENLILCAECPSAYHLECHDPPLRHPPRGRWVCNDCKTGVKRRTRRGAATQDARKKGRQAAKRKRYVESSEEESSEEEVENEDDGEDEETEDEDSRPPPRKVMRTSRGRPGKGGRKISKNSESPKNEAGRPKGRRSAPSPETVYESRPKISRRAPSELSVIEDIINRMLDFKAAWPFWHNVSKKDVPDYYDIIKQPMSFQKIKDRLNCLVYGSPQEVIDDVALVFRNAVEYNKVGSEVYECIEVSEKHFVDLMKRLLPFYAYNRDTKSNGYGDHMYSDEGRKSRKSK